MLKASRQNQGRNKKKNIKSQMYSLFIILTTFSRALCIQHRAVADGGQAELSPPNFFPQLLLLLLFLMSMWKKNK